MKEHLLKRKTLYRFISIFVGLLFLTMASIAQEETVEVIEVAEAVLTAETVQTNLNQIWLLLAGFLVFFMQAGFAMLEGGFIRHTGVVNSLAENFMDVCITGIVFFLIGYGIAYGAYDADEGIGSAIIGVVTPALGGIDGTGDGDGITFIDFFFQFAFAGAAATIATGAMAERTNFKAKLIYSAILGALLYPVVVFWTWGGGWIDEAGFIDFAGSTIVHQFGGIMALMGAIFLGPRVGRVWGRSPRPSNMALAAMGTFILWFGWYGFNVGSTLEATDPNQLGLVAVNTTLAAAAGALGAMFFQYMRTGHWDLAFILNGSLAGLVGITAGCAYVTPIAAIIIGLTAGVVVILSVEALERAKIDDAVGAFAVHGACGMLGSLAIGFWGVPALTETAGGLFMGGGFDLLGAQILGVVGVTVWAAATGGAMFATLNAMGILRMPTAAEAVGIDAYEHNASVWPDVLPIGEEAHAGEGVPSMGD